MISDTVVLAEVRKSWQGATIIRERLTVGLIAAVGSLDGIFPHFVADAAHNLPFVHACSVLNDVLEQLAKEGHFNCGSWHLGALVDKSKKALPWNNHVSKKNRQSQEGYCPQGRSCSARRVLAVHR